MPNEKGISLASPSDRAEIRQNERRKEPSTDLVRSRIFSIRSWVISSPLVKATYQYRPLVLQQCEYIFVARLKILISLKRYDPQFAVSLVAHRSVSDLGTFGSALLLAPSATVAPPFLLQTMPAPKICRRRNHLLLLGRPERSFFPTDLSL